MSESRIEELQKLSNLEIIGRNLTKLAAQKRLGPLYEIKHLTDSLMSLVAYDNRNVLLVGEPGVGKNAVVEGFAKNIARKSTNLPPALANRNVFEISVISFQANCVYVHDFETRIHNVINNCIGTNSMLFFDNINLALDSGKTAQSEVRNLANLLSPYLSMNKICIIGATTIEGYNAMLRLNPSFTGRFSVIHISPATKKETFTMLLKLKKDFEKKYVINIHKSAINEIITVSDRNFKSKCFPGKAFELLYEIIAETKSNNYTITDNKTKNNTMIIVKDKEVLEHMKRKTGLPGKIIMPLIKLKKENLRSFFRKRVLGQEHAIESIINTILRFKAELNDPDKPLGSYLFVGPTGVGKTEIAKTLAEYLFGSTTKLLRYDMSEYNMPGSVEKLIGGYGAYNNRGIFVEDVFAHPFSVILFDEIEKAHPDIYNLLLQILGEGRITDRVGRTANMNNCIIIMTSNLGSELYTREKIGIYNDKSKDDNISQDIIKNVENYFNPEFINRLTEIIVFNQLSVYNISRIAKNEIQKLLQRDGLKRIGVTVEFTSDVVEHVVQIGYSKKYGARPMKRTVEKYIGFPLAELIAKSSIKDNEHLIIDVKMNKICISIN